MKIKTFYPEMLQRRKDRVPSCLNFLHLPHNYTVQPSTAFPEEPDIQALSRNGLLRKRKACFTQFTRYLSVLRSNDNLNTETRVRG